MNDDAIRFPGARIRRDIEANILSGAWPPGHRIPFEHALMQEYGCSRMTVNKAISALAAAGLIVRRRHTGSTVAAPGGERAMMEIQNLAEEAARLGQPYRHEIISRRPCAAGDEEAAIPGLRRGTKLLHVICRHWIADRPHALEDRLIALPQAPAAAKESFADIPPGTWLLRSVPWSEAEHVIRAHGADKATAGLLDMPEGGACLALDRRTWNAGRLVTAVTLTYPGERHRFVGRFSPTGG
jgi:GntR family histidine utilization transcriptional repressor